jgi:hypothetical protein
MTLRFSPLAILPIPVFLLMGCGIIPLQSTNLDDFTIAITAPDQVSTNPSSDVGYLPDPQIKQTVPLVKLRIYASLKFTAKTTAPIKVNFYVRSSLPTTCTKVGPYFICSNEPDSQKIGSATLIPNTSQDITLEGQALSDAVHAGNGYLGLQLEQGIAFSTDRLEFSKVVAQALL